MDVPKGVCTLGKKMGAGDGAGAGVGAGKVTKRKRGGNGSGKGKGKGNNGGLLYNGDSADDEIDEEEGIGRKAVKVEVKEEEESGGEGEEDIEELEAVESAYA